MESTGVKSTSLLRRNSSVESMERSPHNRLPPLLRSHTLNDLSFRVVPVKPTRYKNGVTIEEISQNTAGKHQYESSTVNYQLPTTEAFMERKDRYQTQWSKQNGQRNTYVDMILKDSKKKEKTVPGPTAYSPDPIAVKLPRSVSQIWSKEKKITYIDRIMKTEKRDVAPNTYKTDEAYKEKVVGVYLGQNKNAKQGLLNDQEFAWLSNPAMNQY